MAMELDPTSAVSTRTSKSAKTKRCAVSGKAATADQSSPKIKNNGALTRRKTDPSAEHGRSKSGSDALNGAADLGTLIADMPRKTEKALDATQLYLNEIGYSPLLTADEEKHYARLARAGDEAGRKRMIESNLRLVVKISRRYINRGLPLLESVAELPDDH